VASDDARQRKTAAVADLVWTGEELLHLRRFRDNLQAATELLGHNDALANLFLEDALADLHGVLGDSATPVGRQCAGRRAGVRVIQ
jgi:hypothetical protein